MSFSETNQRGFLLRSEANNYKAKILELKNAVAQKNVEIYGLKQEYEHINMIMQHQRGILKKLKTNAKEKSPSKYKEIQ